MMLSKKTPVVSLRLTWVDWMKSIAIYFIVSGHINRIPLDKYICVFSVPFLCRRYF